MKVTKNKKIGEEKRRDKVNRCQIVTKDASSHVFGHDVTHLAEVYINLRSLLHFLLRRVCKSQPEAQLLDQETKVSLSLITWMGDSAEAVEGKVVEIKISNGDAVQLEELRLILEQKSLVCLINRKKSLRARFSYGIIFLLTNLIAWCVRDYGQRVSSQLHYLKACGTGGHDCFHTMGVLRVSLGCFTPDEDRSELARVGAGIFLILQLVSVIEFIAWWNSYWMPDDTKKQSCFLGLFMSTLFYIASFCGIVVMYALYAPTPSCSLNIFFITWTTVLLVVMMIISLHSKVNRGLLSSGIMASYIVFLCWSAIRSEPALENCSPQKQENKNVDWTTVLGFLIAICAIVMATFSTGIDSQTFQFRKDEVQLEDDIPYKYGFFHLIFSLGAMYFAMLFISWNLESSTRKWSIDVGWASTWVKIVNEWFAATIYLWKLISPIVRQAKVMDREDPVQQIDDPVLP
ncbi:hypothetical protein RJ640_005814 [Escallonia rubra]|uniref:Serine incorporator n=1 Tax=Escallonia rubra TaxID=112253 RepID=A0AA88UNR2_9ASTE|nr:hypothetical protein RJ640_005814 [Escallonia rubra]